ncbi:MAG: hypothetical protein KC649_00525, partial [Candidatus Omnitrophica bacterium]|nr:hypothetical protein [Candidatus Omnitrophota bacterium]
METRTYSYASDIAEALGASELQLDNQVRDMILEADRHTMNGDMVAADYVDMQLSRYQQAQTEAAYILQEVVTEAGAQSKYGVELTKEMGAEELASKIFAQVKDDDVRAGYLSDSIEFHSRSEAWMDRNVRSTWHAQMVQFISGKNIDKMTDSDAFWTAFKAAGIIAGTATGVGSIYSFATGATTGLLAAGGTITTIGNGVLTYAAVSAGINAGVQVVQIAFGSRDSFSFYELTRETVLSIGEGFYVTAAIAGAGAIASKFQNFSKLRKTVQTMKQAGKTSKEIRAALELSRGAKLLRAGAAVAGVGAVNAGWQITNNLLDGKTWHEGAGTAFVKGAAFAGAILITRGVMNRVAGRFGARSLNSASKGWRSVGGAAGWASKGVVHATYAAGFGVGNVLLDKAIASANGQSYEVFGKDGMESFVQGAVWGVAGSYLAASGAAHGRGTLRSLSEMTKRKDAVTLEKAGLSNTVLGRAQLSVTNFMNANPVVQNMLAGSLEFGIISPVFTIAGGFTTAALHGQFGIDRGDGKLVGSFTELSELVLTQTLHGFKSGMMMGPLVKAFSGAPHGATGAQGGSWIQQKAIWAYGNAETAVFVSSIHTGLHGISVFTGGKFSENKGMASEALSEVGVLSWLVLFMKPHEMTFGGMIARATSNARIERVKGELKSRMESTEATPDMLKIKGENAAKGESKTGFFERNADGSYSYKTQENRTVRLSEQEVKAIVTDGDVRIRVLLHVIDENLSKSAKAEDAQKLLNDILPENTVNGKYVLRINGTETKLSGSEFEALKAFGEAGKISELLMAKNGRDIFENMAAVREELESRRENLKPAELTKLEVDWAAFEKFDAAYTKLVKERIAEGLLSRDMPGRQQKIEKILSKSTYTQSEKVERITLEILSEFQVRAREEGITIVLDRSQLQPIQKAVEVIVATVGVEGKAGSYDQLMKNVIAELGQGTGKTIAIWTVITAGALVAKARGVGFRANFITAENKTAVEAFTEGDSKIFIDMMNEVMGDGFVRLNTDRQAGSTNNGNGVEIFSARSFMEAHLKGGEVFANPDMVMIDEVDTVIKTTDLILSGVIDFAVNTSKTFKGRFSAYSEAAAQAYSSLSQYVVGGKGVQHHFSTQSIETEDGIITKEQIDQKIQETVEKTTQELLKIEGITPENARGIAEGLVASVPRARELDVTVKDGDYFMNDGIGNAEIGTKNRDAFTNILISASGIRGEISENSAINNFISVKSNDKTSFAEAYFDMISSANGKEPIVMGWTGTVAGTEGTMSALGFKGKLTTTQKSEFVMNHEVELGKDGKPITSGGELGEAGVVHKATSYAVESAASSVELAHKLADRALAEGKRTVTYETTELVSRTEVIEKTRQLRSEAATEAERQVLTDKLNELEAGSSEYVRVRTVHTVEDAKIVVEYRTRTREEAQNFASTLKEGSYKVYSVEKLSDALKKGFGKKEGQVDPDKAIVLYGVGPGSNFGKESHWLRGAIKNNGEGNYVPHVIDMSVLPENLASQASARYSAGRRVNAVFERIVDISFKTTAESREAIRSSGEIYAGGEIGGEMNAAQIEIYKADLFEWSQRLDTQQSQGVTVVKVERILTSGQNAADVRGRTAAAFINNNQGLNDTEQPEAAGLILQIDDRKVALTNEQGITLAGLGPDISAADYDVFMSGYRMDVNDHQAVTIALQNTLENNAENASRNTQLFVSGLTLKLAEQGNVQVNEASALLASAAGVNGVSAEDVLRGAEQAAISAGDQTAGARIVLAATRATADRLTESAQISVALETQTGLSIQEGSYISEENRNMAPQILSVGLGVELNFEGRRMVEAELQHFAGLSFDARIDESDNTREMIELIGSETRTVVSTASTQEEFRSELETKILNGSVNQDQALGSFIASALSNANAELTVTNIVEITIEAVLLQDADTHKNLIKALFEGVVVAGLQQESVGQMTVAALNTLIEKANVQAENLQDNDLIQAALEGAMKAAVNFNLITTAEGFEQAVDQIAQAVQQVIANVLKVDVVDDKVMEAVAEMVKVVVQAAVNTVLDIEANTTLSEAQQLAAVKAVVTGVTKGITAAAIDAFANPATQMTEAQMISIVETAVDQMFDQMFGQDSKLSAAAQAKYRESIVTGITRGVSEAVFEAVNNGKLTEDQAGRVIEAAVNRVVDNIFDAKFGFTAQAKGQMVGFAINGIAEAALAKSADRTQAMNRISQFTRTAVTAIFGKLTSGATPEEITQIFQGFAEGLSAILNNTHIQVADRLDVLKTTIGTAADQILKTAATPDQRKAAIGGLTAGLADIMNNTTLQSSERVEALQTAFNAVLTAIENIGSEQLSDKEKQELLQQAFDSLSAALAEKISDISRSDDADVTAEKKAENQQEALIVLAAAAEQVLEAADSLSERASKEVARTTIASFTDSLSRIITAITGETVADGADLATVLRNLDGSLLDTSVATLTVKANVITSAL